MMTTTETNRNQMGAGWDTRTVEAPARRFFRLVLALSVSGALGYLLLLGNTVFRHPGNESLVGALSVAADASAGLIYGVTVLVVVFGVVVIGLSVVHPEN
jgi:hypothetical protein